MKDQKVGTPKVGALSWFSALPVLAIFALILLVGFCSR
jgi:hypothetical protein